jgi:dTDP-4-dehydrorhamnose 3,5-epimerase-like enzyme
MDARVEALDVHEDERGWVSEVYSGAPGEKLGNIHLGTLRKGFVRGNHLHRRSREWIILMSTPVEVALESGDEIETFGLDKPSRVFLPPGIAHAFRNTGTDPIHFVAYRDSRYDQQDPDVEPRELFPVS